MFGKFYKKIENCKRRLRKRFATGFVKNVWENFGECSESCPEIQDRSLHIHAVMQVAGPVYPTIAINDHESGPNVSTQ